MRSNWTDRLPCDVYRRLCTCRNLKSDLPILTDAKWAEMVEKGMHKEGLTKEDALVAVLDHLDCNSQWFDLTRAEYDALIRP